MVKKINPNLHYRIGRSSAGFGLFAKDNILKGDLVIEYIGEKITEDEAYRRGGKYLFELNDNWTIDGKGRDNIARYLNHACKPNCEARLNDEETRIFIYAKRNIAAGEELTYNYGKIYLRDIIGGTEKCLCESCKEKRLKS